MNLLLRPIMPLVVRPTGKRPGFRYERVEPDDIDEQDDEIPILVAIASKTRRFGR